MKKSLIWLIVVVIILAVIYFVIKGIEPKLERGEGSGFEAFTADGVSKIELITPGGQNDVTLVLDDVWEISFPIEYAADEQSIERLLKTLTDMKFETIVSENPEKQDIFEISEETGSNIKLYKGDEVVLDFYTGKTDQTRMNTYIREAGSDKVYAVQGNISSMINRPVDQWRDKAIVNIPENDPQQLEVTWGDTTVVYTLIDTLWSIVQDDEYMELHQDKLGSIIRAFSPLRATQFQDEPIELDWKNPDVILNIHTLGGPEYICRFIAKDDKQYYAVQGGNDQVYIVSKYVADRFKKKYSDYQNVP